MNPNQKPWGYFEHRNLTCNVYPNGKEQRKSFWKVILAINEQSLKVKKYKKSGR